MNDHLTFIERLVAYRLLINIWVCAALTVMGLLSVLVYYYTDSSSFLANLALATSTSLFASVFVIAADTFLRYKERRNEIFLEGIQKLGISNLHFNKKELLADLMQDCQNSFWASGYRLILTASLGKDLERLARQRVSMRLLCVPPWSTSFKLVYGNDDFVMDHYIRVLNSIYTDDHKKSPYCQVRFCDKPLFSDTYLVDDKVITGPYMHNRDSQYKKLSANDFFTYELHRRSKLHDLVKSEFETLWEASTHELNWAKIGGFLQEVTTTDLTDEAKQERLKACLVPLTQP